MTLLFKLFLKGDSARVHSPAGGIGMNLGIEDAFVFTELLVQNRLNEYDFARGKAVRDIISKIRRLTFVISGQ